MGEFQDKLKSVTRSISDIERDNDQRQISEEVQRLNSETERFCKVIEDELVRLASSGEASVSDGKMLVKTDYINLNSSKSLKSEMKNRAYGGQKITWSITPFGFALIDKIKMTEAKKSIVCDFKVCVMGDMHEGFFFTKDVYRRYFDCTSEPQSAKSDTGFPHCQLCVSASTYY